MRAMQEITKDGWHAEHHVRHRESQRRFPSKGVEFMFPNFFLLPPFRPCRRIVFGAEPESCLFEIWSLVLRPESEAFDTPKQPTVLPYDSKEFPEIPQQTMRTCRCSSWACMRGFDFMRLSNSVEGMIATTSG